MHVAMIIVLKALCPYIRPNCLLMSSLTQIIQLKWHRKYGYAQYHGIDHGSTRRSNACNAKKVRDGRIKKPAICGYG